MAGSRITQLQTIATPGRTLGPFGRNLPIFIPVLFILIAVRKLEYSLVVG